MLSLDGGRSLFSRRYRLYARFDDVAGLFVNAPVRLAGYGVGRVREVRFEPLGSRGAVRVELELDRGVRELIRSDSTTTVYASGLLGDMYVGIAIGSPGAPPLAEGDSLPTREPVAFQELQARAARALAETADLAADARRITADFARSVRPERIAAAVDSIAGLVREIERGRGLLHELVYTDAGGAGEDVRRLLAELRGAAARGEQILARVQSGPGLANGLVYGSGPGSHEALTEITASATLLHRVLRKLDDGEGSLGALINDPTVYEQLRLLLGGAQQSALLRTLIELSR